MVAIYDMSDRLSFSGTFVYAIGQATTIVESFYVLDGDFILCTVIAMGTGWRRIIAWMYLYLEEQTRKEIRKQLECFGL